MWPFKKTDPVAKIFKSPSILRLQPGDTLVFQTDDYVDGIERTIRKGLSEQLGFNVGVMVVSTDVEITVIRGDLSDKPPPTPIPSSGTTMTP